MAPHQLLFLLAALLAGAARAPPAPPAPPPARCPSDAQHIQVVFIHVPKASGSTLQATVLPEVFNASGPCFSSSAVSAPGSGGPGSSARSQIISGVFHHQTYESVRRQTNCTTDVWSAATCSQPSLSFNNPYATDGQAAGKGLFAGASAVQARESRSRARLRSFLSRKREVVLEDGNGQQKPPPDCRVLGTFLAHPLRRFVSSYYQFARGDVWGRRRFGVRADQNRGFNGVRGRWVLPASVVRVYGGVLAGCVAAFASLARSLARSPAATSHLNPWVHGSARQTSSPQPSPHPCSHSRLSSPKSKRCAASSCAGPTASSCGD